MSHNKIKVGGQSPNSSGEITVAINDLSDVSYSSGDLVITSLDTIKVPDASGTDTPGTTFNLSAGASTGSGNGGSINLRVAPAGTSGSSVNAHENALTINSNKEATFTGETRFNANIALNGPGGHIGYKENASAYPAISINSTGDITKIGQSTATSNYVLTWNGSAAVWAAGGGGGASAPDVVTDSSGTDTTISSTTGIEEIHLISNGLNAVTITIPSSSTAGEGYKYQIKRLGTANVTVKTATPSTDGQIDGSDTYVLSSQYESVTIVSDNSNYFII